MQRGIRRDVGTHGYLVTITPVVSHRRDGSHRDVVLHRDLAHPHIVCVGGESLGDNQVHHATR